MNKGLLFSLSLLPSLALAGDMGSMLNSWSKVATLSLGPTYTSPGSKQTITLQPDIQKTYTANDNTDLLVSGELFLGEQRMINDILLGQLGVTIAASSAAQIHGQIWEDASIDLNNFNYKYSVSHEHIAVKGKLLANTGSFLLPYMSGSLGLGINRAFDFSSDPLIFPEVPAPPFHSNTKLTYTYTLGAGFQHALNEHWQAGVGYEFADWGQSALGRATGQTINAGPQLSHFYTQQLQFSITYLAGE